MQYALSVAPAGNSLALLIDAAAAAPTARQGRARVLRSAESLLRRRELSACWPAVAAWLDRAAPADDPDLLAADGGIAWLGVGISGSGRGRVKIYLNQRWGRPDRRWARVAAFAGELGCASAWEVFRARLPGQLAPLGVSLEPVTEGGWRARIYLGSYGLAVADYARLAGQAGGERFAEATQRWLRAVLGDDHRFPTRSGVFSISLSSASFRPGASSRPGAALSDAKVELCAHCAFDSDEQAAQRSEAGLAECGLDPLRYRQLRTVTPRHAYLGLGSDGRAGFYFDPGATG